MNIFQSDEQAQPDAVSLPTAATADGPGKRAAPGNLNPMATNTHRAFAAGHVAGEEERRWCEFYAAALTGAKTAEDAIAAATVADVAYACLAQRRDLQRLNKR